MTQGHVIRYHLKGKALTPSPSGSWRKPCTSSIVGQYRPNNLPSEVKEMSLYTTGELAKAAGVTVRTVQYYDKQGLLRPSDWTEGGRRLYTEEDLEQLRLICYLRELDFSLTQIKNLLGEQEAAAVLTTLLDSHIAALEKLAKEQADKLQELHALRKGLQKESSITLNQLPGISLTMKQTHHWRYFAIKQFLKLLPIVLSFIGLAWFVETSGQDWLMLPTGFLYLGGVSYWTWNYYQQITYICPLCKETFRPTFKRFLFANHTPRTRKLTCPHCHQTNHCVEIVKETCTP